MIKSIAASIAIAASLIFAPMAHAESCADVQAAIAAHNGQNNVFPNTAAGRSAAAAYDAEASALESRQTAACGARP